MGSDILIIDDNENYLKGLSELLRQHGKVTGISDFYKAMKYIHTQVPDIVFIDLDLGNGNSGQDILEAMKDYDAVKCILTANDDDFIVENCINLGADHFLVKGNEEEGVLLDIIRQLKESRSLDKNYRDNIVPTNCRQFKSALNVVFNSLNSELPVLLTGETGSGKTFLSRVLHKLSGQKGRFVELNCNVISDSLFESEMFGHVKGAFSGANDNYDGKILMAHEGTLFLDEIDSLSIDMQTKLLKVLEEKKFYPVGSNKLKHSNFQLITASQRPLFELVSSGKFREDLYFRLSFLNLILPPLRDRKEDIIDYLRKNLTGSRRYFISSEAEKVLVEHSWPGNLRELKCVAKRLELLNKSNISEIDIKKCMNYSLSSTSIDFFTPSQLNILRKVGYNEFISNVKKEVLRSISLNSRDQVKDLLDLYKIPKATYYSWKKSYNSNNEKVNER